MPTPVCGESLSSGALERTTNSFIMATTPHTTPKISQKQKSQRSTTMLPLLTFSVVLAGILPSQFSWAHNYDPPSCGSFPGLIVNTTSGELQGTINSTSPNVRQFLGIPYAEPPVGRLRFQPPAEFILQGRKPFFRSAAEFSRLAVLSPADTDS